MHFPPDDVHGFLTILKGSNHDSASGAQPNAPPHSAPTPLRNPRPLNGFAPPQFPSFSAAISSDRLSAGGPVTRTFPVLRPATGDASLGSFSNGLSALHPMPPSLSADPPFPSQPVPQRSPPSPIPHLDPASFANNSSYHPFSMSQLNQSPNSASAQPINYSPQPAALPRPPHQPAVSQPRHSPQHAQQHAQQHPQQHAQQHPQQHAQQHPIAQHMPQRATPQPLHHQQQQQQSIQPHHPQPPSHPSQPLVHSESQPPPSRHLQSIPHSLHQPSPYHPYSTPQPQSVYHQPPPHDPNLVIQPHHQPAHPSAPPTRPVEPHTQAPAPANNPDDVKRPRSVSNPSKRARPSPSPRQTTNNPAPTPAPPASNIQYWPSQTGSSNKSRSANTAPSNNDGNANGHTTCGTEEQSRPERKREREKRRRETMNTRFNELAQCLVISAGGKSDKESVLAEAVEHCKKQASTIRNLERQNRELISEANVLRSEKTELRRDKNDLREERDRLKAELDSMRGDHKVKKKQKLEPEMKREDTPNRSAAKRSAEGGGGRKTEPLTV